MPDGCHGTSHPAARTPTAPSANTVLACRRVITNGFRLCAWVCMRMVSAFITGQVALGDSGATQALVDQAAKAHGLSKSRCVAEIICKYPAHEWPQDCMALALAGRFADFPLRDAEGAKAMTADSC